MYICIYIYILEFKIILHWVLSVCLWFAMCNQTSPIQNFFKDRSILITGGLGAVGKVLFEKLLRSCPGVKNIYLVIRSKKDADAKQRFDKVLRLPVRNKNKASMHFWNLGTKFHFATHRSRLFIAPLRTSFNLCN